MDNIKGEALGGVVRLSELDGDLGGVVDTEQELWVEAPLGIVHQWSSRCLFGPLILQKVVNILFGVAYYLFKVIYILVVF